MAEQNILGRNRTFAIYNANGTPFHDLVLHKSTVESVVMSLGDKISGDVYYKDSSLEVTMKEYIVFDDDVHYVLVNPPTIVREGTVANNSELKGMTKYSFTFYHPMYMLGNFVFTDIAVTTDEQKYLSQDKTFAWIGTLFEFIDKINANLRGTEWIAISNIPHYEQDNQTETEQWKKASKLSEVVTFDKNYVSDALKTAYEQWEIPFIIHSIRVGETHYSEGKRFAIEFGLPSQEIYNTDNVTPFVFQFGQGVGLKNNSRTPRNNKIVTRIFGYGSDNNIPFGYPQIRWYGNQDWDYTINNDASDPHSYPIYQGIVGGEYVKLIKHPFTRKTLMPSSYTESLFNKISPYLERAIPSGSIVENPSYDPDTELVDYLDAIGNDYPNNINPQSPSCEIHQFEDIKPEFNANDSYKLIAVYPLNKDMSVATDWDDTMDDNGEYIQSYFKITLPQLQFDIYACAAITEKMEINMRSGACLGCTFDVEVDWEDYKRNFYNSNGDFDPVPHTQAGDGHVRDITKYPDSSQGQIDVIVKKDLDTFGTLMPNMYQQPKGETTTGANNGDLFVILGISLPTSYVHDAELRLDAAMKAFMIENNDYYFDYPLKFDEHFLATHTNILSQIRNNNVVRFNYNGVEHHLYISRISIKYGDSVLPQYDITLTDDIDVVLNKIGEALNDIQHINYELLNMQKNFATTIVNVERDVRSGKVNRFYYYAQEWSNDATIGYDVNDLQAPYFSYNGEFWIFNPKESGYYTMAEMGQPQESSVSSPTSWVRMISEFKYIITEAIFANYAHFGSAIINGDWLLSTNGTINGVAYDDGAIYNNKPAYTWFDPSYPTTSVNTTHTVNGVTWNGYNFVPNLCFDLLTGATYQQNAYIKGEVNATSGNFVNVHIGKESTFGGLLRKAKTVVNNVNIGDYATYDSQNDEYLLDLTKTGTFIEVNDFGERIKLVLPAMNYNGGAIPSSFTKDYIRSLIGNTIILYNNMEQGDITIRSNVADDETSAPVSLVIAPMKCVYLECKMRFYGSSSIEEVYWQRRMGSINSI